MLPSATDADDAALVGADGREALEVTLGCGWVIDDRRRRRSDRAAADLRCRARSGRTRRPARWRLAGAGSGDSTRECCSDDCVAASWEAFGIGGGDTAGVAACTPASTEAESDGATPVSVRRCRRGSAGGHGGRRSFVGGRAPLLDRTAADSPRRTVRWQLAPRLAERPRQADGATTIRPTSRRGLRAVVLGRRLLGRRRADGAFVPARDRRDSRRSSRRRLRSRHSARWLMTSARATQPRCGAVADAFDSPMPRDVPATGPVGRCAAVPASRARLPDAPRRCGRASRSALASGRSRPRRVRPLGRTRRARTARGRSGSAGRTCSAAAPTAGERLSPREARTPGAAVRGRDDLDEARTRLLDAQARRTGARVSAGRRPARCPAVGWWASALTRSGERDRVALDGDRLVGSGSAVPGRSHRRSRLDRELGCRGTRS